MHLSTNCTENYQRPHRRAKGGSYSVAWLDLFFVSRSVEIVWKSWTCSQRE